MTAARLIIWRHGRTEWNHTGLFQGQADIPLDEHGRKQARVAAKVLAGLKPTAMVSSDLARARETAAALAKVTGLDVPTDARLREIHVGSWEGLTGEQIREVDPELAERYYAGEDVRRSATGETVGEVAARVADALADIAAEAEDGAVVVVVMHGLAARVGACQLVGMPEDSWRLLGAMRNCGWIILSRHRTAGFWRIDEYNVTADHR